MPDAVAQEYEAVALQFDGRVLSVAFAEPPSPQDVDALASKLGLPDQPGAGRPDPDRPGAAVGPGSVGRIRARPRAGTDGRR